MILLLHVRADIHFISAEEVVIYCSQQYSLVGSKYNLLLVVHKITVGLTQLMNESDNKLKTMKEIMSFNYLLL